MTKQTKYESGRSAEYLIGSVFKKAGFHLTRSAASKGEWDLVAVKRTPKNEYTVYVVALMQVKKKKVK